jgi:hypothetical protein
MCRMATIMGEHQHLRLHSHWVAAAFAVAWIGAISVYWIHIKMNVRFPSLLTIGTWTTFSGIVDQCLVDLCLFDLCLFDLCLFDLGCYSRCDGLGRTRYLFCGNRGPEAEGILATTFGHLFRGRAFRCGWNFPQRTAPSAGSALHDNLGAIVLGSVAVHADGAAPPTER